MTALDNLMAARHIHMKSNLLTGAIFWGPAQREEIQHRRHVEVIIDFLEMQAIRKAMRWYRVGYDAITPGNKPGIHREASAAGNARRKGARGLSETSTPRSSRAEAIRRA